MCESEESLAGVLSEFARTMLTDFPIQKILDHLVLRIVDLLPITSAGVTLIAPGRDPQYVAASDGSALVYERLQTDLAEGPCLGAFVKSEAISVPDLAVDDRFPTFRDHALEAGLGAVFTFPLRHDGTPMGALDLYRDSPGALDDEAMEAAQTLADVAAAYLINADARDIARATSEHHRQSSLHDALTGLPNRVLFRQFLEHGSMRARRSHAITAILFLDLDRFKVVNDTHGHHVGDEVLVAVAERLRSIVRPGDVLSRISGDEFIILCEDLEHTEQADVLARRVVEALAAPFELASVRVSLTASVGIAFAGRGEEIPDQLVNDADEAMYQAKRA